MEETHNEFMERVVEKTRKPELRELTHDALSEDKNDALRKEDDGGSQ